VSSFRRREQKWPPHNHLSRGLSQTFRAEVGASCFARIRGLRHLRSLPPYGLSAPDECQHPAWPLPDERNVSTDADRGLALIAGPIKFMPAAPRRGSERL
jgi:hypothetical protein